MSRGEVIVAHPGAQHSYETALGLQEAGLLKRYITGIYYKPASAFGHAMRLVRPVERRIRRRYKHELAQRLVRQYPLGEALYLTGARLKPLTRHAAKIIRWRNRRFDNIVARVIERERPDGLVSYDTCSLQAFRKAGTVGTLRILDQSIGHWRTLVEMLREEAERHPDFADSLLLDTPEEFLAQCTEEALMADRILVGSLYAKDTMIRYGVEPSRIRVIPYGADIDRFRPVPHPRNRVCRLLFVGQLSQRKGIKYLLEAIRQLAEPDLELTLVGGIVGSGLGLAHYRDHFIHADNVPHHEVHQHFQRADVFVYPSLHEGSAIAVYEALATGLPVITTPNSGSVVRDGIEGFIVPIRDVETLKDRIMLLRMDTALREEMGHNARKRSEQFTWAAYRRRLANTLDELLFQSKPRTDAAVDPACQ
jgi:glycosyltransferase involved in cell wall biosynthesis